MNYFNCNGKTYSEGTPIVGADNRGLRFGDGLFETIKMLKGRLILEDEHFARLWKGMKALQFDLPKHFSPDTLLEAIKVLANKNGHSNAARIRINIFRGDGGLYDAKNHSPNYIIQTWPLPDNNGDWNSNGLVVGIYDEAKKSCDSISNLKHNNYLPYVLGALKAKEQKWNDAFVLNTHGRVCDSTIANIFLIHGEAVSTPALKEGCVAGVMRKQFIQVLSTFDWQVQEKEITIDDLLNADEVFLTNSIYNARWVQRLGDKMYTNIQTQKMYAAILPTIV